MSRSFAIIESWIFSEYFESVSFAKGDTIFLTGSASDSCYLIKEGLVRLELGQGAPSSSVDPLLFLSDGEILGELGFFDGLSRSLSAYAETDLETYRLSKVAFERLSVQHPSIAFELLSIFIREISIKLRATTIRLDNLVAFKHDVGLEEMLDSANAAQEVLLAMPEDRLNDLLLAIVDAFELEIDALAESVVQETGIGNVLDKSVKHRLASRAVYENIRDEKLYGVMSFDESRQLFEVGEPLGIILGFIPVTNPVSTFIFKVLSAIKARNALILVPNRQAFRSCERVGQLVRQVLLEFALPAELIQWEGLESRKRVLTLMRHKRISLVLATGGAELVRAAYSSGNPAIGVGSGNSPTVIASDANLTLAAQMIVESKSFDNGLICGSEHNLIVESSVLSQFVRFLEAAGAAVLTPDEMLGLEDIVYQRKIHQFPEQFLGQDAEKIAALLSIERSYSIRLLVVPIESISDSWICREKLAPISSLLAVENIAEAFMRAGELLALDGQGHTAVIHTQNESLARDFALKMPVSRVLFNSPAVHGIFGLNTGLDPSLVLACGSHGNSLTTENITARNLINRKRLALPLSNSFLEFGDPIAQTVLRESEEFSQGMI